LYYQPVEPDLEAEPQPKSAIDKIADEFSRDGDRRITQQLKPAPAAQHCGAADGIKVIGKIANFLAAADLCRYAAGSPCEGNFCNPRSALKAALLPLSE
jgi:hypothetical protein